MRFTQFETASPYSMGHQPSNNSIVCRVMFRVLFCARVIITDSDLLHKSTRPQLETDNSTRQKHWLSATQAYEVHQQI